MKAKVIITLKPGLLDVQGKAVKGALDSLGFRGVTDIRIGKYVEIELNHARESFAARDVKRMCRKLLANPVIEEYRFDLERLTAET